MHRQPHDLKEVLSMKALTILLITLMLTSCGWFDRKLAAVTGGATKTCIDGVEYLQFTSGATVAYTREGKVKTCSN
jgi:hypothetical protein